MSALFEELDYRPTRLGTLTLRRRRHLPTGETVYEIKLNDEYLMSSLFTASEVALAQLGLAALPGVDLDIVVGGLGLGYTAQAVLTSERVRSLVVIDALAEVIEWHQQRLLPLGPELTGDPRCRLVHGDFFAAALSSAGLDPDQSRRRFHGVLVDIDHSPANVLDPSHAVLYTHEGLTRLSSHLHPGGVFALWSNDPPDDGMIRALGEVFTKVEARVVTFENVHRDEAVSNTIYVSQRAI